MSRADWLILGFGLAMVGVKALLIVTHDRGRRRSASVEGEDAWPDPTWPHGGF